MVSTIQVDEVVKKKLFRLKLQLSEQEDRNISYNELIDRLLQNTPLTLVSYLHNREEMRKYRGSLPKGTRAQLEQEQNHDFA